ncbi:hypothetical protein [Haladaptatus sp. NG-SE-30]
MSTTVDSRWLLGESLRIGAIILLAFLIGAFLDELIGAFALELLYGLRTELISTIRYTGIVTAVAYADARGTERG